ncbi:MAG: GNAT family N-acetyltransferase [Steroidobacteraceae bacterium]
MTHRPARFLDSIAQIDAQSWNALAGSAQPFLRHEFLLALEESGCAAPRTGWAPQHLIIDDAKGAAVAAMPLFRKAHSRGEFVFDFSWASAYAQHGLRYYPKLLTAVPFTPVRGPRLLLHPAVDAAALTKKVVRAVIDYARSEQLSSWHVLFPTAELAASLDDEGMVLRRDCQFHWYNQGYESFEAFLATFTAEKRKKVKRERRRVAEAGIEFDTLHGAQLDNALWNTVYQFYADTFHRHGHEPYLNLNFFKRIGASMPDQLMLKVARIGREPIAVAIFLVGENALFGRYWGAGGNYHSLHFETCYYQGIEYCIDNKLQRFEPGTQGEHKVPRGFVPTLTSSAHFIADQRFAAAIRDFARREARGVDHYAAAVNEHVPYHRAPDQELQF